MVSWVSRSGVFIDVGFVEGDLWAAAGSGVMAFQSKSGVEKGVSFCTEVTISEVAGSGEMGFR